MEKRDVTKWGIAREDVQGNHIGPKSFSAIFSAHGHLANCTPERSELMQKVIRQMYGTASDSEPRLQEDLARAGRGEKIYCPGAEQLLFPKEQYQSQSPPQQGTFKFI